MTRRCDAVSVPDRHIPDYPQPRCSSYAWLGLGEIEELPGSCREGHEGQGRPLLCVIRVKAVGIVYLNRSSLVSLRTGTSISAWPPSSTSGEQPSWTENHTTIQPDHLLLLLRHAGLIPTPGPLHLLLHAAWNMFLHALQTFQVSDQTSLLPQDLSSPCELKCSPIPHPIPFFICFVHLPIPKIILAVLFLHFTVRVKTISLSVLSAQHKVWHTVGVQ